MTRIIILTLALLGLATTAQAQVIYGYVPVAHGAAIQGYPVRADWQNSGWTHEDVGHMLNAPAHSGKFDRDWLMTLSYPALCSLHADDHEGRVKWGYVVRAGQKARAFGAQSSAPRVVRYAPAPVTQIVYRSAPVVYEAPVIYQAAPVYSRVYAAAPAPYTQTRTIRRTGLFGIPLGSVTRTRTGGCPGGVCPP